MKKEEVDIKRSNIKPISLITIFSFVFLLSIFSVIALATGDITIQDPAASGTLTGTTATFNVTHTVQFDENYTSINVYISSGGDSANTSLSSLVTNLANFTDGVFNGTVDSSTIEDATDYTITFELLNGTDPINVTRTVVIDNGIPTAPTSPTPASGSVDTDGSINFSATVSDSNTTACTLFFVGVNPGSTSYTMTYSENTCTHTISNVADNTYNWYVQASDGTNTTDASSIQVQADIPTSGAARAIASGLDKSQIDGGFSFSDFAVVAVFLLILWYFLVRRKK